MLLIFYADVDECETNGTCPEHSTCSNTFGSFVCTCKEGFLKNGSVCIGKNSSGVIRICPIKATFFHQMLMNVTTSNHVQNTPPVQTPLDLLYAPAMKDSWGMAVCAVVRIGLHLWNNLWSCCILICYKCMCHTNWTMHTHILLFFSDIDECSLERTCVPEAVCTNSFGSFSCVCRIGFTGNETYCAGKAIEIEVAVQMLACNLNVQGKNLV